MPVSRGNIVGDDGLMRSVGCYLEGERLASEGGEGLVRGAPVVAHADPPGLAPLDPHLGNVPASAHVHHVHQQPVPVPLELEPYSSPTHACHPTSTDQYQCQCQGQDRVYKMTSSSLYIFKS